MHEIGLKLDRNKQMAVAKMRKLMYRTIDAPQLNR